MVGIRGLQERGRKAATCSYTKKHRIVEMESAGSLIENEKKRRISEGGRQRRRGYN